MIDLHTHSSASDGTLSPAEVIHAAHEAGLRAVALTDHDTVAGLKEAAEVARSVSITFVPGVEISAEHEAGALHIVGLFVDSGNQALLDGLEMAVQWRHRRNEQMALKLTDLGLPVTMAELAAEADGGVVGRPHFARVMVKKGYVSSFEGAIRRYLRRNSSVYVRKERMGRRRAVELIRAAGGVPVLAHPDQTGVSGNKLEELIRELVSYGLEGIETHCSGYRDDKIGEYARIASRYGLAQSGGSDFHGSIKPGLALGKGPGSLRVPDEFLPILAERADGVRKG